MSKRFYGTNVQICRIAPPRSWVQPCGFALRAALVAAASVLGCKRGGDTANETAQGCTHDTQCKGERICAAGRCQPPAKEPEAHSTEPELTTAPAAGDFGWTRGGPGGPPDIRAEGPIEAPRAVWDVDLGAVVYGRPALVPQSDGRVVAYAGTHAGRFVGVVTEGEGEGEIVLDLMVEGMIWASPAVDERGWLYFGADDDTLYAVDPASRSIAWRQRLGNCQPTRAPGPEGSRCDVDGGPTLGFDGDLYVGSDGVYRVTTDGEIVWHWSEAAAADGGAVRPKHVFSTPVVTRDGLVVFGGQDGMITALNTDGELQWQYKVVADVDGSPAVTADGSFLIGADDGRVYALRPDGSLRWSFVTQRDIRSAIGFSPQGYAYATSFDGGLYALDFDGNVRWVLPTGLPIASSPVVDARGTVYFGGQDDRFYAVDPEGNVLFNVEFPADIDATAAIAPGGTVVVGADDGHLRGLR